MRFEVDIKDPSGNCYHYYTEAEDAVQAAYIAGLQAAEDGFRYAGNSTYVSVITAVPTEGKLVYPVTKAIP